MKVKFVKCCRSHYTFNSPYSEENGRHTDTWIETHCGNCDRNIEQAYFYKSWDYCPYCGTKIDWRTKENA